MLRFSVNDVASAIHLALDGREDPGLEIHWPDQYSPENWMLKSGKQLMGPTQFLL